MIRNVYYKDLDKEQISKGLERMLMEMNNVTPLGNLPEIFNHAWETFENNEWSYDGATFVEERYGDTLFEVAAFIHDYRNSFGYVGKSIDLELLEIMILLNYPFRRIIKRWWWMRLTFFNILIHRVKGNYKRDLPDNLFTYE